MCFGLFIAHCYSASCCLEEVRVLLCWGQYHFRLLQSDGVIHEKGLEISSDHILKFIIEEILGLIIIFSVCIQKLL